MTNEEKRNKFFNPDGSRKTLGQIFIESNNRALMALGDDHLLDWNKMGNYDKESTEQSAQIVFDDFLAYYKEFMY